jgi:hypothetical protein
MKAARMLLQRGTEIQCGVSSALVLEILGAADYPTNPEAENTACADGYRATDIYAVAGKLEFISFS